MYSSYLFPSRPAEGCVPPLTNPPVLLSRSQVSYRFCQTVKNKPFSFFKKILLLWDEITPLWVINPQRQLVTRNKKQSPALKSLLHWPRGITRFRASQGRTAHIPLSISSTYPQCPLIFSWKTLNMVTRWISWSKPKPESDLSITTLFWSHPQPLTWVLTNLIT